mmetsp:Transcript_9532/g.13305  ORF Transcript_9532/g.13305 Transcript_9532/m.13305 type:complete len:218 (-) Transcript_9532:212-865(-)
MKRKSVMAGLYTAPPAHGPITSDICGTTPDASTFLWNTSAYPAKESTPSCILAPPESLSPMTGAPTLSAMSMILQIFCACVSLSDPPKTVKSWLKAYTTRPFTSPCPVMTPSPGTWCTSSCASMPNSVQRCDLSMSTSRKLLASNSRDSRSRAVRDPRPCCFLMRGWPPPSSARDRSVDSRSRKEAFTVLGSLAMVLLFATANDLALCSCLATGLLW